MSDLAQVIQLGIGVVWGTTAQAAIAACRSDRDPLLAELRLVLPLPLSDGETLADWRQRFHAVETSPARRAMIEARIAEVRRTARARQVAARAGWVAAQRAIFARPAVHVHLNDMLFGRRHAPRDLKPEASRRITDILLAFIDASGWRERR